MLEDGLEEKEKMLGGGVLTQVFGEGSLQYGTEAKRIEILKVVVKGCHWNR